MRPLPCPIPSSGPAGSPGCSSRGELTLFQKGKKEALVDCIARGKRLRAQLEAADNEFKEDELCLLILKGLAAGYETVNTIFRDPPLTRN